MTRHLLLSVSALTLTLGAFAQTKISGSIDCDKSDPVHAIPIPDREGYAYVISQEKCTWTKALTVEGLDAKTFVHTFFNEVMGAATRTTSTGVTTYSNGDKGFTRATGTVDAKAMTISGKWTMFGGTGKVRGVKGGGGFTCKMKGAAPGSGMTCDVEGEYTLPAAPAAKKK